MLVSNVFCRLERSRTHTKAQRSENRCDQMRRPEHAIILDGAAYNVSHSGACVYIAAVSVRVRNTDDGHRGLVDEFVEQHLVDQLRRRRIIELADCFDHRLWVFWNVTERSR